jgi:hypothetical protein
VLNRIQLRAIGRQPMEGNIVRNVEVRCRVPACLVENQHDLFIPMGPGEFLKKDGHGFGIHLWKDEGIKISIKGACGRICIGVFPYYLRGNAGTSP